MVIKKRTPEEEARAAAIDAFADGATPPASLPEPSERPAPAPAAAPASTPAPRRPRAKRAPAEDAGDVALTLLVRFPDADLPTRLQRLADADDRSKHYITLRAIEAGLAVLEA